MLTFSHITKTFAGVTALADVSFDVAAGEVHALVGENGAGKSTLGKILAGIHRPDSGTLLLRGQSVAFRSPRDAARAGVAMVHQELAFCPDLSIAENLALGRYPARARVFLARRTMATRARELLAQVGAADLEVTQPIRTLSTAQEQLVQIAAAIGVGNVGGGVLLETGHWTLDTSCIIFDEPTSSLSETEAQKLFSLIETLRRQRGPGLTIIYVSHRLPEIFRLADRITVLRDGRHIATLPKIEATTDRLVHLMLGRPLTEYLPPAPTQAIHSLQEAVAPSMANGKWEMANGKSPPLLSVHSLSSPGRFSNISFALHPGEILGLAGLVGAGRSEVAQALFGLDSRATGAVAVQGQPLPLGSPRAALRAGLALVPEDRKRQGLVLNLSNRLNFSLPSLRSPAISRGGFLRQAAERRLAEAYFSRLDVRTPSLETPVAALSGGNQQKVVLAKWLAAAAQHDTVAQDGTAALGRGETPHRPTILLIDEPTRGIDIGAKAAIHALLLELAAGKNVAILLISSELPELLALATRILVLREGRLVGELPGQRQGGTQQEDVLRLMAGIAEVGGTAP